MVYTINRSYSISDTPKYVPNLQAERICAAWFDFVAAHQQPHRPTPTNPPPHTQKHTTHTHYVVLSTETIECTQCAVGHFVPDQGDIPSPTARMNFDLERLRRAWFRVEGSIDVYCQSKNFTFWQELFILCFQSTSDWGNYKYGCGAMRAWWTNLNVSLMRDVLVEGQRIGYKVMANVPKKCDRGSWFSFGFCIPTPTHPLHS